MTLTKKYRIILFVILSFIYILFFSIYNVKADITNWVPTENFYYYYDSPQSLTSITIQNLSSQTLLDYNFYFADSSDSYNFSQIRGRTNLSNTNAQYFTFVLASLIQLNSVEIYNPSYFSNMCNIEEKSINDIYFYYAKCESNQAENMWQWGFKWENLNENVSITNFGISPLYHFQYYDEMIEFEDIFNAKFEEGINDGTLEQQVTNIYNTITSSDIDDSNFSSTIGSWSSSVSNNSISNLITLPIAFLTGVNDALSDTCVDVIYITLYDYELKLPCLNLSQRLGSVWVIIDTIFSLMLIYSIGKSLVKTFARLSDMDTNIMYECYSEGMTGRSKNINGE